MPHILVVDDDQDFYFLVQTVLGRRGFETTNATDGNEALAAVRTVNFDAIVMDKVMPGIDGFEVARQIRQESKFADLPILIVSGAANPADKAEAFEAGADDYLTKPFSIDELSARVAALVESTEDRPTAKQDEITPGEKAKLIAVHSLRGGLGSSSIAANLALGFRELWQQPALLLDLNLVCGQIALLLNTPLRKSWADVADLTEERIDRATMYDLLSTHISGLKFLPSPKNPLQADELSPGKVKRSIEILKSLFDYMVVDAAHDFSDISLEILNSAESIILVLAPDIVSVRAAAIAMNRYASFGISDDKVTLVLNQPYPHVEMTPPQIEDALHQSIVLVVPHEPRIFTSALNAGKPFLLEEPDERVSAMFIYLAFKLSKESHRVVPPKSPSDTWLKLARQLKLSEQGRPKTASLRALIDWFR